MPINYRKNSSTLTTDYYSNTSCLNGPGISQSNRINVRAGGQTNYVGLVSPGHDQASDLAVLVDGEEKRLAKKSKFTTTAYSAGYNEFGQLGDGTVGIACKTSLVLVCYSTNNFIDIYGGGSSYFALEPDGTAWAWGINTAGQLGDNSLVNKCCPVRVCTGGVKFCAISAGGTHSLALEPDGTAWAWGCNFFGTLGDQTISNRTTPVRVCTGGVKFCAISAGGAHSLALEPDGTAWAWGLASCGALGNNVGGTTTCYTSPVRVCGDIAFCSISASVACSSLAIGCNGLTYSWGFNQWGNLGNNSIVSRLTPGLVCCGPFCFITSGSNGSYAIDINGEAWAWGSAVCGQLGNNVIGSGCYLMPVRVCCGPFRTIISAVNAAFGIKSNGEVWGWGGNETGRFANGTINDTGLPVRYSSPNCFYKIAATYRSSVALTCLWS